MNERTLFTLLEEIIEKLIEPTYDLNGIREEDWDRRKLLNLLDGVRYGSPDE